MKWEQKPQLVGLYRVVSKKVCSLEVPPSGERTLDDRVVRLQWEERNVRSGLDMVLT